MFSLLLALTVGSASAAILTQGVAHFQDQPYWCGKAKVVTVDGKKVLELTSTAKGGREFARAYAIYGAKEPFAAKEKIVATATVKGTGKFFIGILKYRPKSGAPNTVFVEPVDLTETAREVKFVFEIEDTYDRVFPFFHIPGKGNAVIESFKLEKVNDPALKVSKVTSAAGSAPAASKAPSAPQNKVLLSNVTSFYDQPYWSGKAKKITGRPVSASDFALGYVEGQNKEGLEPTSLYLAQLQARNQSLAIQHTPTASKPLLSAHNGLLTVLSDMSDMVLYSADGKKVYSASHLQQNQVISTSWATNGMYFAYLYIDNQLYIQKIVL